MTSTTALYVFWNSFGIPFYPSTSVPKDAVMPYGTYEANTGNHDSLPVSAIVNLWYRTDSELVPDTKAESIGRAIDNMRAIKTDDGYIMITRGDPWCQALTDDSDHSIKRRYINVTYHFFTK